MFPCANDSIKLAEDGLMPSDRVDFIRIWLETSVDVFSEKMVDLILWKNKNTLWKPNMIFGACLEASFSASRKSFLIPLKYMDVVRHTQTNLDMLQEQKIDDSWNVDGERPLSVSWIGFTRSAVLKKRSPEEHSREKD